MCGICGFTWRDDAALSAMVEALAHRGPDANGRFVDETVSIGHTRLSILDLTETGRQPMLSGDGRVVVSYNGEIYNFPEIRKTLEGVGRQFRGRSDTEVLLHGYLEWGDEVFARLNGMWAVCIYMTRGAMNSSCAAIVSGRNRSTFCTTRGASHSPAN